MFSFANKNLMYVGALGGIGFETCKLLMHKHLANLVAVDFVRNDEKVNNLQAISATTKVTFHQLDIRIKDEVKRVIHEIVNDIKYIDVLINGAGIANDRQVDLTIDVNLRGVIYTTLEALPYMNKNQNGRGGLLANISSTLGLEPCPPCLVYSATKHGVIGFTRSLADEFYYNLTGVTVMAICPGLTTTPMTESMENKDTFEYAKPLSDVFYQLSVPQSAEVCAENLIKAIETNQNGTIWRIEEGQMKLANP